MRTAAHPADRSQWNEDDILRDVVAKLRGAGLEVPPWVVEFGAWDGEHLSNAHYWLAAEAWSGVLIEGDARRVADGRRKWGHHPGVTMIHSLVGWEGRQALDQILATTAIPETFGILSIDVDGNDYHIWSAVTKYKPMIAVVEFNPTIPVDVHFVQKADPDVQHGTSLAALASLGKQKGYSLVAVTKTNGIFVKNEHFPFMDVARNAPADLWLERPKEVRAFVLYDGTVCLTSEIRDWWGPGVVLTSEVQIYPSWARGFDPRGFRKQLRNVWLQWVKLRRRFRGANAVR